MTVVVTTEATASLGHEQRLCYTYSHYSFLTLQQLLSASPLHCAHFLLLNESKAGLNSGDHEIFLLNFCLIFNTFLLYPFASHSMFTPHLLNKGNTHYLILYRQQEKYLHI